MSVTELDFLELIEEHKYEEVSTMYYYKHQYRNEFDIILSERNVKDKVIEILNDSVENLESRMFVRTFIS